VAAFDEVIVSTPARMGGIPCFAGTRVAVHTLFDCLAASQTIPEFLDDFPTVSEAQVRVALLLAADCLDHEAVRRVREQSARPVASTR
jgi:uncharacterized protein (DUF433 family)